MSRGRRKKKKNGKAVLLVLTAAALILAACCLWEHMSERDRKTQWQEGCFLKVGDVQVDIREGMVYLDAAKSEYEKYYGEEIWDYPVDANGSTMESVLKEEVLEQIVYIKVVCRKADELGILLSTEELQQVETQTAAYMEKIADSPLKEYGVNADIVRRIYSDNLLARKTYESATLNVNTEIPDEEARQRKFYSVAVRCYKVDASGEKLPYEGEEAEELKNRTEELLKTAQEQKDFYAWASSVTEDIGSLELSGGAGDFPEELEEVLFTLSDGELSEIVWTEDYGYIFYCVSDFDIDATLAVKEQMIYERQKEEFQLLYATWKTAAGVELNEEEWKKIGE